MILLIDNYDSFTFNLFQYIEEIGYKTDVKRNDKITLEEIGKRKYDAVVISPGPCTPVEAKISVPLIKNFKGKIPIFGVCLGHQSIGVAFGGKIVRASKVVHGKISEIFHDNKSIFNGLSNPFEATRYHSLIIDRSTLPDELVISAQTKDGIIMAVRHKKYAIEGVQFHPESILTKHGKTLLKKFFENYVK